MAKRSDDPKTTPVPVRLDPVELACVRRIAEETGLTVSEVLRRCVRLLIMECKRRGAYDWLTSELTPRMLRQVIELAPNEGAVTQGRPIKKEGTLPNVTLISSHEDLDRHMPELRAAEEPPPMPGEKNRPPRTA